MGMSEDFSAWAESEKGKEFLMELTKGLDKKIQKVNNEHKKISKLTDEEFNANIDRLIGKYTKDYMDQCYQKLCEPYPNHLTTLLFEVADHHGQEYPDKLDEFDRNFGAVSMLYRNHIFNWIHGQGTVLRIFRQDEINGPQQLLCI